MPRAWPPETGTVKSCLPHLLLHGARGESRATGLVQSWCVLGTPAHGLSPGLKRSRADRDRALGAKKKREEVGLLIHRVDALTSELGALVADVAQVKELLHTLQPNGSLAVHAPPEPPALDPPGNCSKGDRPTSRRCPRPPCVRHVFHCCIG